MSPLLTSIQLHHYGAPLDFPTRRHAIALTLILVSFRSIQFKLSNNQAKLSKQSITTDAAIRIVLLTLQGCTATHMKPSVTAFGLVTLQAGVARTISTTFTSQPSQSSLEPPIWDGFHTVNPAGLPKWYQKMCVWCISRSRLSRSPT